MEIANKEGISIKLLLIAVGIGLLAALLAVWYLNAKEAQLRRELTPQVDNIQVVVATQELLRGTVLNGGNLAIRSVPAEFVHSEAVLPGNFSQIDGKTLLQNIGKGNVILASYVGLGYPLDFSDTIPLKRRAMTIQVDTLNSINGFIRPGNRIDLFVNLPAASFGGEASGATIMPVLENVEVIATGDVPSKRYEEQIRLLRAGVNPRIDTKFTTLTLNVTPQQAAMLAAAIDGGDLLALLRNRDDTSGSGFEKVDGSVIAANAAKMLNDNNIREAAAAAQGFVVGPDGIIRTKDGTVLKNQNLIIGEDGTIMTKDGIILNGTGLTVNENGDLVDADGNIIDPDTLTIGPDGSIITADGRVLGGSKGISLSTKDMAIVRNADGTVTLESPDGTVISGLKVNADGMVVMPDGSLVDPKDLVITSDGRIMTKDGREVNGTVGIGLGKLKVNPDGTITTASGVVIKGATMREDGMLVLADGTVVDPDDVVIGADGTLMTKDGKSLGGLSIEGATLNEDGMLVLPDGTIVDPKDVIINPDGSVMTKDGKIIEGLKIKGATMNADGKLVLADGSIVDPANLTIGADGKVRSKGGLINGLSIEGATLNEDGMLVLPDGTIVDPKDVIINPDGTVMTKDGKIIEGLKIKGATLNADGKLVLADGTVVDPADVEIGPDGKVRKKGKVFGGLSADASAVAGLLGVLLYDVDYIVGGVSEDGVATVKKVPVESDGQ